MAKLVSVQSGFSWGEASPKLLSRVDLEQYEKATKTMLNCYSFLQGGVRRRPGTFFVGAVVDSGRPVRLIPFILSSTTSYLLVFNAGYMQVIDNTGAFVETSPGVRYSLTHTYTDDELYNFTYAQAGAIMFIAHNNHKPSYLQPYSPTSWVFTDVATTSRAITNQWFENHALTFKILAGSTRFATGDRFYFTMTSGIPGAITTDNTGGGAMTGNGVLTQISVGPYSPDQTWYVTCLYAEPLREIWEVAGTVSGQPTATWYPGNYPRAVAYFGQRLYFAGSVLEPQSIWGSSLDNYTDFTLGTNDADGVKFIPSSNNYDAIVHLTSARSLLLLTYSAEFSMTGAYGTGITASSVKLQPETFHGCNTVRPIRIGSEVVFIQRDGLKARAISYDVTSDTNTAPDITLFSEHITESGIRDATFAQDPDYIAWMVRNDGVLLSLSLAREYETYSWSRHTTDGKYKRVSSIPSGDGTKVFVCVERIVNSVAKQYIELMDYTDDLNSDCGLSGQLGSGITSTTWSGLAHLEGKTVDIVADGIVHPEKVVTGGQVVLNYACNAVRIGLPYNTTLSILHPEFGDGKKQSTSGASVSITEATFKFYNTINCTVNGYEVPFRTNTIGVGTAIPPFTGDKKLNPYGWRVPTDITIEQRTPMPWTLLGITLKGEVNK